ncbi:MAG: hypothetical protein ACR2P4_00950 [Gammaproteobacteria bacterium]
MFFLLQALIFHFHAFAKVLQTLIFDFFAFAKVLQALIFDFCAFANEKFAFARHFCALINVKLRRREVLQRQIKAETTRAKQKTKHQKEKKP